MSDTSANRLTLDEIISCIELQQAETGKFANEAVKLAAEAGRPRNNRWLSAVVAIASVLGAVGASLAAYGTLAAK